MNNLQKLYKYTAHNAPFMKERKLTQFNLKLKELREEYPRANEIRKPEIKKEADEIKEYIRVLREE